jgi:DNA-directed RNA polymerase specialized sigma24 family protein
MPDDLADLCSPEQVVAICRRRVQDFRQLSPEDQEDATQQAATRVFEALRKGAVSNLEAFARRVAYHCAVDAWRRLQMDKQSSEIGENAGPLGELGIDGLAAPTPEWLVGERQRRQALSVAEAEVRELLATAPDNYRHVLARLYLDNQTFEDLVDEEIRRRVEAGATSVQGSQDLVERQRARNAVHAWHSRALRWLQQRAPSAWREVIR